MKKPSPRIDLFSLAGTSQAFSTQGVVVETRIIDPMKKTRVHQDVANPFHQKDAFVMSRLTLAKEVPVLLEEFFLDVDLFAGIDTLDLSRQSLAQVVSDQYYLTPTQGTQQFKVETPGTHRARVLGLSPKQPVLVVRRELNFPNAPTAVFSTLYCCTDQFAFSQTIQAGA